MDDEVKNRESGAGGLDDLLDEILQKNMEEEVQKGEESVAARAERAADSVNASGVSSGNRSAGNASGAENADAFERTELDDSVDDRLAGSSSDTGDFSEQAMPDEDYAPRKSSDKPTPEEYLDDVFGDAAESGEKDDEDIRVIEVEVGSEDDTRITKKDILSMLLYVVIIFLLTFVIVHYVGQRTRVSGSSMENTLSNGDNLIVDKLSYRFHDPERFDVIIFPFQYETDTYYIKRIIGLPGETVQIGTDGTIYINGEVLDEDYGLETIQDPGMAIDPIVLGEDEYFVLGDNRNNSSDSRFGGVGKVKRETIIGRAWIRIYPFDEIKKL